MSYSTNIVEQYRRAAVFVDKIFKGAKPSDLPVEQPTRLELIVNMKTAKALGLTFPQPVSRTNGRNYVPHFGRFAHRVGMTLSLKNSIVSLH